MWTWSISCTQFQAFFLQDCLSSYWRMGVGGEAFQSPAYWSRKKSASLNAVRIHDIFAVMWREARETKPYFRIQEKSITRYHTGLSTRCHHYQYGIQCLAIGDRENIVKNRKKWCRGIEVEQLDELDEAKHGSNIYKETKPQNVGFS